VRQDRDDDQVRRTIAKLASDASEPDVNLMPALIDASKAYATVGEMMGAMAGVFGRYFEVPSL
jgi:methylmalonyl-CoA mutase N-terminal domain/subunit